MKISVLFKSLCLACAGLAGSAYGQVYFSFSGGNGSPLSVTLDAPVSFTVTQDSMFQGPGFVLNGVGLNLEFLTVTQTMTYSINGGASFAVDTMIDGTTYADITPDDLYFYSGSNLSALFTGDVVRLEAATFYTLTSVAAVAPANGVYDFFIMDDYANKIGTGVSAIPEPSTYAAVAGALMLGVTFVVRRRRA